MLTHSPLMLSANHECNIHPAVSCRHFASMIAGCLKLVRVSPTPRFGAMRQAENHRILAQIHEAPYTFAEGG